MAKFDPLKVYRSKRDFSITSEPEEDGAVNESARSFVVQKHWARRLHYDFRLELDGAMKSWAIPKGPSFDPGDKRMAVHVEDHPVSYNTFEGTIPEKQYGAGKVIIWDKGAWMPVGNARRGYQQGKLVFDLHGHKLQGRWALIRMKGKTEKKDPWLLIKEKDGFARTSADFSVVDEMPDSVARLGDGGPPTPADKVKRATKKISTLPTAFKPELATLVDAPPVDSENWSYEIKFDGYRLLARIENGKSRLFTRNGNDWTGKLSALAKALDHCKLPDGWYDGEIVLPDNNGIPDFQALQNAFDKAATQDIVYFLFDIPFCDGLDLTAVPLVERRKKLAGLLKNTGSGAVRFSQVFDAGAGDIIASACKLGLEGVIGKRKSSPYTPRRSSDWIKLKCVLRQEFVIAGYTDPQGSRKGIGSLLLGVHDKEGKLRYVGNVGTGFNDKTLLSLSQELKALKTAMRPFDVATGIDAKAHWVKPRLLAEVSFGQWTKAGHIRHAVFHGLRTDKPPKAITREESVALSKIPGASKAAAAPVLPGKMKITHGERVVDRSTRTTKLNVVHYYAQVAPVMLEHLKARPVSLVRAPDGIKGTLFFQKHLEADNMAGIRLLPEELDPDHASLMEVVSAQGLLTSAQMNVIEFHTWNAVKSSIAKPDRMTFDLDPGKGVQWAAIQEAALVLHSFLQELELASFVKTSGGKGLHVVVPLQRRHDWDTVKDFSKAVVLHMATTLPGRFSSKSGPRNRVGKIFIDYLRNGFGATTVAAWSLRARPGMGVSVPVAWDEVESLTGSAQWNIANIHERLDVGNEPWLDYQNSARTLTPAMKILGFKRKK